MCGIAGICNCRKAVPDPRLLREMIDLLCYRRVGASGVYVDRGIGLAHAAEQAPMHNADESIWIVCDGEAYNRAAPSEREDGHRTGEQFRDGLILHLYQRLGEECVQYLGGQWSFAIWDDPQQKLFLSRDPVGARPLFYTRTQCSLLFASSIRCFLAHPDVSLESDVELVGRNVATWGRTDSSGTAFQGIFQLMPGFSLVAHHGELSVHQYWAPWHSQPPEQSLDRDRWRANHR